jgi:hypothetical protein
VPIGFFEPIADVVPTLKLRRDTANSASLDVPLTSQPLDRVEAPCPSGEFLPAVATFVEQDWVEVDAATVCREHHQARGEAGLSAGVVVEPDRRERSLRARAVRACDDHVDIAVRAGLFPNQRVDSPATIKPDRDFRVVETVEQLDQLDGVHDRSSTGSIA